MEVTSLLLLFLNNGPTFYRSFARCRSPLRPTTRPFDIRGVVFPAPYTFLPKVT